MKNSLLHPNNKHLNGYDFQSLILVEPSLNSFVRPTKYGNDSIDFFNPKAVLALNKALLKKHYGLEYWNIPKNYLCPPVPGRADYIHYIQDLLKHGNSTESSSIKCLDLGVGASCIYPIIGCAEYGWYFIASDIDETALDSANKIIENNSVLKGKVELRQQTDPKLLLKGVLRKEDRVDVVISNPPFHSSAKEAIAAASKKASNLRRKHIDQPTLNFGGQQNELWCEGGEYQFVKTLIRESKNFANAVKWFSSLISKNSTLPHMENELKHVQAKTVKVIEMRTGNKVSRILCWSFTQG